MKSRTLIQAAIVAALAAAPALSFAQADTSQAPKTRAEVRAELIQLEQAGYNPALSDDAEYPANIQAAEARVHQQNDTGYGPATNGTTQSSPAAPQTAPANSSY